MKFTLVPSDSLIRANDISLYADVSDLDPAIHAVQWYGDYGEIEWQADADGNREYNTRFTDMTPFQKYLDRHAASKIVADKIAADRAAAYEVFIKKPDHIITK